MKMLIQLQLLLKVKGLLSNVPSMLWLQLQTWSHSMLQHKLWASHIYYTISFNMYTYVVLIIYCCSAVSHLALAVVCSCKLSKLFSHSFRQVAKRTKVRSHLECLMFSMCGCTVEWKLADSKLVRINSIWLNFHGLLLFKKEEQMQLRANKYKCLTSEMQKGY